MKKKTYERPTMDIVKIQAAQMLMTSGTAAKRNGYEYDENGWED